MAIIKQCGKRGGPFIWGLKLMTGTVNGARALIALLYRTAHAIDKNLQRFSWSKGLLPLAALTAYAVLCMHRWVEQQWRPDWDSAIYILAGRSLAAGEGYRYLGEPFFLRPPGLSWLVSVVLRDGLFDPYALNKMVMFFAATTIFAIYFAVILQRNRWIALSVAILTATNPIFVEAFNTVLSEFPFMTLLFAGAGLLQLGSARKKGWWLPSIAGAVCIGGAFYMRTVAVLLVPGMLLVGWRNDRRLQHWRVAVPIFIVIILILPWIAYTMESSATAEKPAEQEMLFDYTTAMFHVDPGDPDSDLVPAISWLDRVKVNGFAMIYRLSRAKFGLYDFWIGVALSAMILAGLVRALLRGPSILHWFFCAYVLLILIYFTHASRLLLPLVPLTYLYLSDGFVSIGRWAEKKLGRPGLLAVPCAVAVALMLLTNIVRLPQSLDPHTTAGGRRTFIGVLCDDTVLISAWIRENTPPDAILMCNLAPVISLLTDRRAYTYGFPRSDNLLSKYEPDYVIVDNPPLPHTLQQRVQQHSVRHWALSSSFYERNIDVYQVKR